MTAVAQLLEEGVKLHRAGQLDQAEQVYQQILRQAPDDPDAWHLWGVLAAQSGKPDLGAERMQRAVALRPNVAVYHLNLGNAYRQLGRLDEAADQYRSSIQLDPAGLDGHVELGATLRRQNRLEESEARLRHALQLGPDSAGAHFHLGTTLQRARRWDEAIQHLREALRLQPGHADARKNLGVALRHSGRFDEAETLYREDLQRNPNSVESCVNLGHALTGQGRFEEALACFEAALERAPDSGEAHTNRSILWLLHQDFARGWPEYEWRWRRKDSAPPPLAQPAWDGRPMPESTILLLAEQGMGDILHFVRYAPLVRQRVGHVLLACRRALTPLLSRCRGIDRLIPEGEPLPAFDVHAPLASLPLLLKTTPATIPAEIPYLEADPERVAQWRQRLGSFPGMTVGLAWQGNPENPLDAARSVSLARLMPVLEVPGVRFVSLQKGVGREQVGQLPPSVNLLDFSAQLDEGNGAFVDTAAVIRNLDLVIGADTSIVHLAGGLGARTWLALSAVPDWRWQLGRRDSPWYPTMRIFRQPRPGDWDCVAREMAGALAELATELAVSHASAGFSSRGSRLTAPVAAGELMDKITILQIKQERMSDPAKLSNVEKELRALTAVRDEAFALRAQPDALTTELKAVNARLWDIEDAIRECERRQDFGPQFIELARAVYHTNDRRAALKRQIDHWLGSELTEEKSYRPYSPDAGVNP